MQLIKIPKNVTHVFAMFISYKHGIMTLIFIMYVSANNASRVTTLEYNDLTINHSQIQVYTPYDYADLYLQEPVQQFDFAVTFSSLEHSFYSLEH